MMRNILTVATLLLNTFAFALQAPSEEQKIEALIKTVEGCDVHPQRQGA